MDALRHGNFRLATLLSVICLGLAVAGCSGDDGDDGAPGAAGAPGEDGVACWDLNENGVGDFVLDFAPFTEDLNDDGLFNSFDCNAAAGGGPQTIPVESCTVCHNTGSIADAVASHALPPIESVSNVTFAVNGADLEVNFDLAADGAPATGYDTARRAYFNNGGTRTDLRDFATLTDNGDGNYTITVAGAGPEAANNNRWLFQVVAGDDRATRAYFYADYPASPFPPEVSPVAVDAEACEACHGPEGIQVHGGGFAASDGAEPCLVCHGSDESDDPDVTPALFRVVHGYHSSIESWRDPVEPVEPHVTYPTYMNNCSVCHETDEQLAEVNAMPVIAVACFSCHGSTETMFAPDDPLYTGLHEGLTGGCETCHAGQIPTAPQTVAAMHNGSLTERSGVIWDGEDLSVTEGAKIAWTITDVADDGTDLTITWQASYDDVGVNPCNATAGEGTPVFFADEDADGESLGNLSILRNYAQGQDFILGTDPDAAGQPGSSPDVDNSNTTCSGNVATTVVPVEETDAMYGRVAIQGKPRLPSPDPDDTDGLMQVRAKTPTFDWVVGEGGKAPSRRLVVDTTQCLNCHVGSLYQHGGNRVDNVDMCLLCHNTAANDQYVRVDNFGGVDASEAYDGRSGQAFGMREMLHAVHSAGETGAPIVIYRGRGIYAWAGSVDDLQNWPTESDCVYGSQNTPGSTVFGSDPATATSNTCQPHNFHTPTYPRGIYDCAACHAVNEDGTFAFAVMPDPTKAMASTVETGRPRFGEQVNDVLEGITTSSCMTCHRSVNAHAYQNGWVPQPFEEGRQTIIDAN